MKTATYKKVLAKQAVFVNLVGDKKMTLTLLFCR